MSIFRAVENGVRLIPPSRRSTSIASNHQGRLLGYKSDCFVGADHTMIVRAEVSVRTSLVRRRLAVRPRRAGAGRPCVGAPEHGQQRLKASPQVGSPVQQAI